MRIYDEHICREVWTGDSLGNVHRELCLKYRNRFSGSTGEAEAARYIAGVMQEYGLTNIQRDWFKMTFWKRGAASLKMISPYEAVFPCLSLPYSPSCDEELELIDLGMGHPVQIAAAGESIRGRAVLADDRNPSTGPRLHRMQKYLEAMEAGARAFLFVRPTPGMLPPTGSLAFNQSRGPEQVIPSVGISLEVASELREWLKAGPVKINLTQENELFPGRDCNVSGDLERVSPDSGLPSLIISAHYDSHDISQGALDNASGTAVVLEVARILNLLEPKLKRRIRFVLFGSEETGLVGSHAWVNNHRDELFSIQCVLNFDCVGSPGPLTLVVQNGTVPVTEWFRRTAGELQSEIVVNDHTVPFSDHFPFVLQGVPAVFCFTRGDGESGWAHTSADTFEKISPLVLKMVAMHAARLVVRLAQSENWPGARRSQSEIKAMLQPLGMEKLLRYEGHWPID